MEYSELCHYGVKGMKWGVRRYQNENGTLTALGKKRNSQVSSQERKRGSAVIDEYEKARSPKYAKTINTRFRATTIAAVTVTAAAIYVHKNPEAIGKVVSKFSGVTMSGLKQKAVNAGKAYVKSAVKGAKEGIDEAVREAPKKAAKAVVAGIVLNQTKKVLDSAVGKEESAKIFQANDNKKIGKFWKVSPEDKDDDD